MRRLLLILTATLGGLGLLLAPGASAISGATLFATHPTIAAESNEAARYVKDLAPYGTRIYMGSGNYSVNSGPTPLAWVDRLTGATGVDITAPTEEINTFRTIGGYLYVPWIDPTICGYCHPNGSGGFTTNAGGWHHVNVFPAAHVYDIAKYGNDWFLSGAGGETAGAVIYRSTDGGTTWRLSLAEASPGGITGWERFYWLGIANGRLFAQAAHKGSNTSTLFSMHAWNGTRWTKVRVSLGIINEASNVETFNGKIYTTRYVFDGRRLSSLGAPFSVADFYVAGTRLYAVSSTGQVAYTTGSGWTLLPGLAVPAGVTARSIAVVGGYVWVGSSANLYRAVL